MLKELVKEWEDAYKNGVKIEDKMNADGVTFEFRKMAVCFKGVTVEILSKRRPNSGLAKDAELDPSRGPSYFVTIFVPSTNKIVENIPSSTLVPTTERMIAILQSLEDYDHDAVVEERTKEYVEKTETSQTAEWLKKLDNTDFSDQEKQLFIDYGKEYLNQRVRKYRADTMFTILGKYHKQIIATDLEACGITKDMKMFYPFSDVMYNITCQLLDRQMTNDYGDAFVPKAVIDHRFWNADLDAKMPAYVRVARSIFRQIYADCSEKPTVLTVTLLGMAKYYEAVTGESVALRLAREAERRKRIQRNKNQQTPAKGEATDKQKKGNRKNFQQKIETKQPGLCSLGSLFDKLGIGGSDN